MIDSILELIKSLFERRKKICIISYYYPYQKPSTSGVGIHVYNLVKNLAKLGCIVHVFTYSEKDKNVKIKIGNGKIVLHFIEAKTPFEIENPVISKRVRYSIFENRVLNEIMLENARGEFDIVHTHGWLTSSAFMLKNLYKLKWIHTIHALERNRLDSMTKEERELYKTTSWIEDTIVDADCLIAVSNSTKSEVIKTFKNIEKKIVVIPNGVDLKLFKSEGKKEKNTILYIGRFSKEKGIELIPGIAEKILSKNKNTKMIVVAAETKLPELMFIQDKFKELEKRFRKRFEWKSKPLLSIEIADLYKKSRIYIQPSFYDSMPLCVLEAMASRNAIVASDIGGIPEIIEEAGILIKPNENNFIRGIQKLLNNRKMLKKYSNLAAERAKQFGWKAIAQKTLSLYEKIETP